MPALRLVHLLPLVSLAILALFHRPVNALVADHAQVARHVHAHDGLARRKRSGATCKPTPSASSSTLPASSSPYIPSTSSSSAPPSTTTAPSSTSGQQKWCLAWGDDPALIPNFAYLPKVHYIYDWNCTIGANVKDYGLDYMAMFWGPTEVRNCPSIVVNGYTNWVAGPNEPEISTQANMSPQEGFNFYMQYVSPLTSQNYWAVGPAVTGAGVEWMHDFMALCAGACKIDCIGLHGYSNNTQDVIDLANLMHNTYNLPVCLTEFAAEDYSGANHQLSYDGVVEFAHKMVDFIDNTPWILMACPFGVLKDLTAPNVNVNPANALRDSNGNPTELAHIYFG